METLFNLFEYSVSSFPRQFFSQYLSSLMVLAIPGKHSVSTIATHHSFEIEPSCLHTECMFECLYKT